MARPLDHWFRVEPVPEVKESMGEALGEITKLRLELSDAEEQREEIVTALLDGLAMIGYARKHRNWKAVEAAEYDIGEAVKALREQGEGERESARVDEGGSATDVTPSSDSPAYSGQCKHGVPIGQTCDECASPEAEGRSPASEDDLTAAYLSGFDAGNVLAEAELRKANARAEAAEQKCAEYADTVQRAEDRMIEAGQTCQQQIDRAEDLQSALDRAEERERGLRDALQALLRRDQRNCQHEETERGGVLWEICTQCGAKWADDDGGKPEWQDPPEWAQADAALAAQPAQEDQ